MTANAIPDAWLAAAVIQFSEHLVTFDADFKKLLKRTQVTVLPAQKISGGAELLDLPPTFCKERDLR